MTERTPVATRADVRVAELQLAVLCDERRKELVEDWLLRVPVVDRARYPSLDVYLDRVVVGLRKVFEEGDWSSIQEVLGELAQQHAHSGLQLENGLQRTLLSLRLVIGDHLSGEVGRCEELLLETLNECVMRFFESYQGIRLASESDRFYTRVIKSLVTALEARDPYTKGHSMSVALLSQRLADATGDEPGRAYLAGLLHDVGKVGVPDSILQKAGPLTEAEMAMMQSHPEMGARILQPVKLYPEVVRAVLHHHENFDGSGYPHGVAGEHIPTLARIIRVADSFDAMTSSRVFRSSTGTMAAVSELKSMSETIYDRKVVDALEAIVAEPEQVREMSLASLQIDLV